MDEFLATALAPPTLIFTIFLAVALLYWLFVMFGALDIEVLDPSGAADADGALEAAGKAAGEAFEGGSTALASVLSALRLRSAPLTVVLSGIALFGWLGCYFGARYLAPLLPMGGGLAGAIVALAALLAAIPLTALVTRPLAPLLDVQAAKGNAELIGKVVVIKTGTVDARFGQAELHDGQAGLLLNVRCEEPDALARGDRALIIGWDPKAHAFEVEPLDHVLYEDGDREARRGRRQV